jgi:hypothetical protein
VRMKEKSRKRGREGRRSEASERERLGSKEVGVERGWGRRKGVRKGENRKGKNKTSIENRRFGCERTLLG